MMLDIDFAELRTGALQYLPIGGLVGFILAVELILVLGSWAIGPEAVPLAQSPAPALSEMSNTAALGSILYTRYVLFFQLSGLILLVAMIGAIVLTLHHKPGVRRQDIAAQVARTKDGVELRKVESGKGI